MADGGCQVQDEEGLVRRAQQNDTQALTGLYEQYFDRVFRYVVIKVGNRLDAEDITAQVFVRVVQSLPSYKARGVPFSAWIFRIARNLVIDHVRKKSTRVEVPLMDIDLPGGDDPTKLADNKIAFEQVAQAVTLLTKSQREVIELRFGADLSIIDTAKIMGKSEGAIKALQHSALQALRKKFVDKKP